MEFNSGFKGLILLESFVTSRIGRKQHSVSLPAFVTERRSGYVFVLVWFSFGDFRLISMLC